jgi:hypothetical protein
MYSFYDMLQYAQQGGGAASKQQQIMQIIKAYSQAAGVDPRQVLAQLQKMSPQQQQQTLMKMAQAVQQQPQQEAPAEEEQQQMMNVGGMYNYRSGGAIGPVNRQDRMTYPEMLWYEQNGGMIPAMPVGAYDVPKYYMGGRDTAAGYGQNIGGFKEGGYMDPAWMKSGGIHINPANKGKFTASAKRAGMGVQEFASHVLANKEDYSSTQVKRANFARNAAKWKHQDGGLTVGQEVDATPEMLQWLKDNGYTYEQI